MMAARTASTLVLVACLVNYVMGIMMIMMAQEGASAPDSKYCDLCGTMQCPATCPDFNNGSSKSLCHIDCKTCSAECKKSNDTSASTTGQNSTSTPSTGAAGSPPPPPYSAPGIVSSPPPPPPTTSTSNDSSSADVPATGNSNSPPAPASPGTSPATSSPASNSSSNSGGGNTTTSGTPTSTPAPAGGHSSPGTSGTPPSCNEKGAICKDPRFIGGDGNLFYFHGKANEDFCIVTDPSLHINGHFIGKSVEGRPRDFTWVQAIAILYGSHRVSIGAKKVGLWDDHVDHMEIFYDDEAVTMAATDSSTGRESWESPLGDFKVTRSRKVNSVSVEVRNLLTASVNVTHVDEEDNRIHKYGIDVNQDCFAHLDLRCSFLNLSSRVDGVLGQTYKPSYQSPVKAGIPMPTMGGYANFKASSLFAADCPVGVFDPSLKLFSSNHPAHSSSSVEAANRMQADHAFNIAQNLPSMSCTSGGDNGFVCRR